MFNCSSLNDVCHLLTSWAKGGTNWCTDQLILYQTVMKLKEKDPTHLAALTDQQLGFRRLCRSSALKGSSVDGSLLATVAAGGFTDAHLPRPYTTHRSLIDAVSKAAIAGETGEAFLDVPEVQRLLKSSSYHLHHEAGKHQHSHHPHRRKQAHSRARSRHRTDRSHHRTKNKYRKSSSSKNHRHKKPPSNRDQERSKLYKQIEISKKRRSK
jgi:hypothetical protein